jgi:hypothetical protein
MTKLIASLFALAMMVTALPAAADCPGHEQMTVQTSPVVTTDAGTGPMTPVPPTTTKTGS